MNGMLAVELTPSDIWMATAIVLLTILAIFSAMAETSLLRVSRAKAKALADEGRPGADALQILVLHPERWLNALLLIVLVSQIVQAALMGILAGNLFGGFGVAAGIVLNISVMYVLAETAPKTWAIQHTERTALLCARPMKLIANFAPLRLLASMFISVTNLILPGSGLKAGPFVSEEELLAVAAEAAEAQSIEVAEARLIESIIEFGDTVVREVMVPRPDMVTVNHDFRAADVMEVVLLNGYSRVPVLGQGIDDIVGLVFAKDLMRAERDGREGEPVSNFVRPAVAVPETKAVSELLREMQSEKFHMAVVVDEYGGTAGLVTLEDLIEELVGEIVDEFDVEDARLQPVVGGGVRVNGGLSIGDANDLLDLDLPEGEFNTVSGLLLDHLGRLAMTGDSIDVDGARLTVERIQGRRIMRVHIDRIDLDADEPDERESVRDDRPATSDN